MDDLNPRIGMDEGVVLRITVHRGDPPEGVLTREGDTAQTEFRGWIALIAAITEACESPASRPIDRRPRS